MSSWIRRRHYGDKVQEFYGFKRGLEIQGSFTKHIIKDSCTKIFTSTNVSNMLEVLEEAILTSFALDNGLLL